MRIAEDAEHRTGRKVAWGVDVRRRARRSSRNLVGAGDDAAAHAGARRCSTRSSGRASARSRSDALGWCVRLVRDHQREWIQQLQDALVAVRERARLGPYARIARP